MKHRVIILAGQSLIANGVTSRLRSKETQLDFDVVSLDEENSLQRLKDANPSVVILDVDDPNVNKQFPLTTLMEAFSSLKVICLNPESSQTRVIQWGLQPINQITDLLNAL